MKKLYNIYFSLVLEIMFCLYFVKNQVSINKLETIIRLSNYFTA